MGWMIGSSSTGRGQEFFSSPPCPDWLWGSYPIGTRGSFPGGKAARAWSYISIPPILLNGVVLS